MSIEDEKVIKTIICETYIQVFQMSIELIETGMNAIELKQAMLNMIKHNEKLIDDINNG